MGQDAFPISVHVKKFLVYGTGLKQGRRNKSIIRNFMKSRYDAKLETVLPGVWKIETPCHAKQIDGSSCGIYTLKMAENYVSGRSLLFYWAPEHIRQARMSLAVYLLSVSSADKTKATEQEELTSNENEPYDPFHKQTPRDERESPYCTPVKSPKEHTKEPIISSENDRDERESPYCTPVKSPKEHTKEPIISSENERDERESPYCTPVKSPKEHTKEPIISFENERMQLRTKLSKKRRSCFWYQTPKRRKRPLYCVCQKSDDGRKYWQCEQCCQWFHPSCIGFKEIQEPRKFYCIECQTVNETESDRECEGEPAINDESKPITLEVIEESYSHIDTVVNDITACEEEPHLCEDQQHKFHHEFLDDHRKFAWKNRLMCRFGQKFISDTDYHELMLFLISERYTYYMRDPKNPVTSMRINMFKNLRESSKLYKVLFKNKNSDDYVRHSLIKDVLVSIVALKTGMPLELAYQKCCATEKSINDLRWQL